MSWCGCGDSNWCLCCVIVKWWKLEAFVWPIIGYHDSGAVSPCKDVAEARPLSCLVSRQAWYVWISSQLSQGNLAFLRHSTILMWLCYSHSTISDIAVEMRFTACCERICHCTKCLDTVCHFGCILWPTIYHKMHHHLELQVILCVLCNRCELDIGHAVCMASSLANMSPDSWIVSRCSTAEGCHESVFATTSRDIFRLCVEFHHSQKEFIDSEVASMFLTLRSGTMGLWSLSIVKFSRLFRSLILVCLVQEQKATSHSCPFWSWRRTHPNYCD